MANYKDLKYIFPASSITSGTLATSRLGSGTANNSTFLRGDQSYQALSEFNDDKLVNDISTLALHQATNNNSAKYNLTNSNVDVYQDSSAIANLVNVARDTTGEYISSVSDNMPTGTQLYLKSNSAANNSTTIADFSGNSVPIGFESGGKNINQADSPIGATSSTKSTSAFWFDGGGQRISAAHANMETPLNFGTGDFTMSTYWRTNNGTSETSFMNMGGIGSVTDYNGLSWDYRADVEKMAFYVRLGGSNIISVLSGSLTIQNDTWYHLAVTRQSGVIKFWKNGVQSGSDHTETDNINMASADSRDFNIGRKSDGTHPFAGRMDAIHIIKGTALYTGTFTPPTVYYGTSSSATGSYESTAQTANSSVNKISAVVTYTNESGTNTLNTDIVLQVSADNGSNWSNATLTAAGTFSTGVLQAVTNDISVTAGTQLKYKISFANQASGSKVARINGVSLSY